MNNIQQADGARIIWEADTQLKTLPNDWQWKGLVAFVTEGDTVCVTVAENQLRYKITERKQKEKKQKQLLQRRNRAEKWKHGTEMKAWQSSKSSRKGKWKYFVSKQLIRKLI